MQSAAHHEVRQLRALAFTHRVSQQRSIHRVTLEKAENPVALGTPFEFTARRFGIFGASQNREELIDAVDRDRMLRKGAQQLALQNEVGIAADRRA